MRKAHIYTMEYNILHRDDPPAVRVTITLNRGVYDDIKRISKCMGLRPSTWITMICTSKANNVFVSIDEHQEME